MNIAKAFLGNVSEYQMPPGSGDKISSMWIGQKEYYLPCCPIEGFMELTLQTDKQYSHYDLKKEDRITHCTFVPHKEADILHSLKFAGILPNVCVKQEYQDKIRICYKRYAYFDVISSMEMMYDTSHITTFTSKKLLLYSQFGIKDENREDYEYLVGNRPELNDWADQLPMAKLKFTIPFTFCKHPKVALPLFLHDSNPNGSKKVQFDLEFRSGLEKLIQMQQLNEDGVWEDIVYDGQYIHKEPTVARPELSASYFKLSEDEKKQVIDDLARSTESEYIQEVSDLIELNDEESFLNQKVVLLKDETPTQTIYWFAQRESAEKYNQCNYVDENGNEPSKHAILFMGDQEKEKYPYMVIDQVEDVSQRMHHAHGKPTLDGFHMFHFGPDQSKVFSMSMPVSVQLKDLNFKLKYVINDDSSKKKRNDDEGKKQRPEYKLYTFLEVSKRICYEFKDNKILITVEDTSGAPIGKISQLI